MTDTEGVPPPDSGLAIDDHACGRWSRGASMRRPRASAGQTPVLSRATPVSPLRWRHRLAKELALQEEAIEPKVAGVDGDSVALYAVYGDEGAVGDHPGEAGTVP